jgi:opacity protein-like surface antigen
VGADYLLTPSILVGALVQFDTMAEVSRSTGVEIKGNGWMAGPYFSARIMNNLFFDSRIAFGKSTNQVNPFGIYTDDFGTTRVLAHANLTGNWVSGPIRVTPSLGVTYFHEAQQSYTDSLGVFIPSQSITLGRTLFGPEVGYRYVLGSGAFIEPLVAMTGIWDFRKDGTISVTGIDVGSSAVRAKISGGVILSRADAYNARIALSYDGIGDRDLSVYGVQVWLNSPFLPIVPPANYHLVEPHFTWTGFYVGGSLGISSFDHRHDFTFGGQDAPGAVGGFDQQNQAATGSLYLGYNYQMGHVVWGVETDVKWPSDISSSRIAFVDPIDDDDSFQARSRLEVAGSVRGRIGYAWQRSLLYATGGLAVGRMKTEILPDGGPDADLPNTVYSQVRTLIGWTAGIGLEYGFSNNVLGRLEFRYTDFGTNSFTIADPLLLPDYGPNVARQSLTASELSAGISYKF